MNFLNTLKNIFHKEKFYDVPTDFISKDNLFKAHFGDNWEYSVSGNSFYSFHNVKDDLKGGLQFSIIWDRPVSKSINGIDDLERIVKEEESVEINRIIISNIESVCFKTKYDDSNFDFHYWLLISENILVKITYMIFEEENDQTKELWLERIKKILNSLEFDIDKIAKTKMK